MILSQKKYLTDSLMLDTLKGLIRDLSPKLNGKDRLSMNSILNLTSVPSIRDIISSIERFNYSDPYTFKICVQLSDFIKRYRFEIDSFSDSELLSMQIDKQFSDLERISSHVPFLYRTELVLKEARKIVSEILGDYDPVEHVCLCRYGLKASVGSPLSKSSLDEKLLRNPLT